MQASGKHCLYWSCSQILQKNLCPVWLIPASNHEDFVSIYMPLPALFCNLEEDTYRLLRRGDHSEAVPTSYWFIPYPSWQHFAKKARIEFIPTTGEYAFLWSMCGIWKKNLCNETSFVPLNLSMHITFDCKDPYEIDKSFVWECKGQFSSSFRSR